MSEKGDALDKAPVRGSELSLLSSTPNPSIPFEHVHWLLQTSPLNTRQLLPPRASLSRYIPDSNSGANRVKAAGPWLEVGSDAFQLGQKMGTEHTDVQTSDQQWCVLRDRNHSSIQDWSVTLGELVSGGGALLYGGEWQGAKCRARFCIWISSATVCDLKQVTLGPLYP